MNKNKTTKMAAFSLLFANVAIVLQDYGLDREAGQEAEEPVEAVL